MRRIQQALLLGCALTLAGPNAGAAQSEGPLRLTLEDALGIAVGSNPGYRRASNEAGLNGLEMQTVWLDRLLPQASLNLFNTGFTGNRQRTATDNFGNPIANPSADWVYFSSTNQSLNLSWRLQGASLFNDHRRQALTNQGRLVSQRRALTGLQVSVQRLYMDALEQRDLLAAEQELIDARVIDLDVSERLFSLALRTRVDVLNAELAVEQQRLQLRQQQALSERALLSLRTGLGDDGLPALDLADEPLPIFDPSSLDADRLVGAALRLNPELEQARVAVETSDLGLKEQRNLWWPRVDMGINVYRRTQLPRGESLFDVSFDESLDSQFFVQFSIPFFEGYFRNRQAAAQSAVQLDNDREAERETRLRIEETVRSTLLELSNQWESLRLAERSLEIAEEALRLAREEYRIGSRTFEDLRSSFNQEADTRRLVITSRHAFVDALLALEDAVGSRVRPDATAPSQPEL